MTNGVYVRSTKKLAMTLSISRSEAALFKQPANPIITVPVGNISERKWDGQTKRFKNVAEKLGAPQLVESIRRPKRWTGGLWHSNVSDEGCCLPTQT